ncbi:MAG: DUF3024 domain-containing protein [Terrimicrobiaceae bacterium]
MPCQGAVCADRGVWRIFWKRASGQGAGEEPCPEAESPGEALRVIDKGAHGCFFG